MQNKVMYLKQTITQVKRNDVLVSVIKSARQITAGAFKRKVPAVQEDIVEYVSSNLDGFRFGLTMILFRCLRSVIEPSHQAELAIESVRQHNV